MLFTKRKFRGWLVVSTLLVVSSTAFIAKPASAHTLDLDGDIAVVLHVNPNDSPTSGTQTSFILFFTDVTNQFTLQKCNCEATILQDTQIVATEQLVDTQPLQSDDPVTFPKPGVYTIAVEGKPKAANAFQPFYVSYSVRVTPGATNTESVPIFIWVGLGVTVVAVLAYTITLESRHNKYSKSKH